MGTNVPFEQKLQVGLFDLISPFTIQDERAIEAAVASRIFHLICRPVYSIPCTTIVPWEEQLPKGLFDLIDPPVIPISYTVGAAAAIGSFLPYPSARVIDPAEQSNWQQTAGNVVAIVTLILLLSARSCFAILRQYSVFCRGYGNVCR